MDGRALAWKQIKAKTTGGQWTDGRDVKGIGTIRLSDCVTDGGQGERGV